MIDSVVPENWTSRLAATIAATLKEFGPRLRATPIILLAVDCSPWNGLVTLAMLTAEEANADKRWLDPSEMAVWRYYDFNEALDSWQPAVQLGREMRAAYEAGDNHEAAADAFLLACAGALTCAEVATALQGIPRHPRLAVSVAHPDDGREFCQEFIRRAER